MTTTGARLDLSDLDAHWAVRTKGAPGDNYLLFDEYQGDHRTHRTHPATIEPVGLNSKGEFELYLHGERGRRFSLDVTTDFRQWTSLGTKRLDEGYWFFTDTTSPGRPAASYRAREWHPERGSALRTPHRPARTPSGSG